MGRCCTLLSKVDMVLFVLGFWHALTFKVILNISWELWTMFHAASQCRECGSHKTQTVPCYTFATLGSEQKSEKGPLLPRGLICPSLPYLCCIMMFRWINKQPGIQSFEIYAITIKISMTEYPHLIRLMVYSNTKVYGGKWEW